MNPKKERGPVARTTEPPCNAVGAIAGSAYRKRGAAGNGAVSERMSALPGFTRPPVWEHPKRDGWLVAGEREFKGAHFFELRLWTGAHGDKATRKGVTMPLEAVPDLARALAAYVADRAPEAAGSGS